MINFRPGDAIVLSGSQEEISKQLLIYLGKICHKLDQKLKSKMGAKKAVDVMRSSELLIQYILRCQEYGYWNAVFFSDLIQTIYNNNSGISGSDIMLLIKAGWMARYKRKKYVITDEGKETMQQINWEILELNESSDESSCS